MVGKNTSIDATTVTSSERTDTERTNSEEIESERGLDWYDLLLTQTFPASDALPLWQRTIDR